MTTIANYKPKKYEITVDGEDLDIDASNDGDYIVCPVHDQEIIFVFGTDWWRKWGGECSYGWTSLILEGWCWRCCKTYKIHVGSYGG